MICTPNTANCFENGEIEDNTELETTIPYSRIEQSTAYSNIFITQIPIPERFATFSCQVLYSFSQLQRTS